MLNLVKYDNIVYGTDDDIQHAIENHDKKLRKLLLICRKKGIRLNRDKCQFRTNDITFQGHRITSQGLKPDDAKEEAIVKMDNPQNVDEAQILQGTVNYLARIMPRLSEVMEPIKSLTRSNTEWEWTEVQANPMEEIKRMGTEAPILAFYDPAKELVIECDASQKGLGAVLMQQGRPIAYASRALTPTETRYAHIEKETLSIVFSLDKFHQYVFARKTTVFNGHKSIEALMKKPMHRSQGRLQGMFLKIHGYDVDIVYRKGK